MKSKNQWILFTSFAGLMTVAMGWAYAEGTSSEVGPKSASLSVAQEIQIKEKPVEGLQIPKNYSKTDFFYLFGPNGNPLDGKEADPEFDLYIDVPQDAQEAVTIRVFDPDISGQFDAAVAPLDTAMKFAVFGNKSLGETVLPAGSVKGDDAYLVFGPFQKEKGKKVGDKYRFNLKVTALSGDDLNLFNVKISPENAEVFAYKFTFALLPGPGERMYFYPEVPAGVTKITARNFDLDKEGGESQLTDPATKKTYKINDSTSGNWADTKIYLENADARRLEYRVTTRYQNKGHAGLEFKDERGNSLPIYFHKGETVRAVATPTPAVTSPSCNRFTFDGQSSYDANNEKLSYKWDFGDGSTSTQPVVTHTFEKGGTYKVNLTVTDSRGLECSNAMTTQQVTVNTPPKADAVVPEMTCTGKEIKLNASASKDGETADLDYNWHFSDGTTATGESVTKAFAKGGLYDVVLTVDDKAGSSCSTDSIRRTIRVNTRPVANAGKNVQLFLQNPSEPYTVTFDGGKSYDADKNPLAYAWDFGDGSTADVAKVQHVYKKGGEYTAKLMVNDQTGAGCDTDIASIKVLLNKAPLPDAGASHAVCDGAALKFNAGSSSDPDQDTLAYLWNFGDGETATGATTEHTYKKPGQYKVTLTADDGRETPVSVVSDDTSVFINAPPTAMIKGAEKACLGEPLTFDASGSSDPDGNGLHYAWDFGDGTTAVGEKSKMTHQFQKGGNYQVRVTVDDGNGDTCGLESASMNVKINTPPIASAGPNLSCCENQSSAFDGSGSTDPDGDALSYRWNFGDGSTSQDAVTSHAYSSSGTYEAILTVDDGSGTSCSQSSSGFTTHVNAKPVPVIKIGQ